MYLELIDFVVLYFPLKEIEGNLLKQWHWITIFIISVIKLLINTRGNKLSKENKGNPLIHSVERPIKYIHVGHYVDKKTSYYSSCMYVCI